MKLKLRSVFNIIPVPIVVTDFLVPSKFAALSLGLLILLRERAEDNEPLIQHELEHCRQAWRGLFVLHLLRYWLDKDYRYQSEVEAYAIQYRLLEKEGEDTSWMGASLANKYGVSVSEEEAMNDIRKA